MLKDLIGREERKTGKARSRYLKEYVFLNTRRSLVHVKLEQLWEHIQDFSKLKPTKSKHVERYYVEI